MVGGTVNPDYNGTVIALAADTQWDEFLAAFTAANPLDGSTLIYSTGFDGGLPAGWTITNVNHDAFTWTTDNPGEWSSPMWQGTFFIADSECSTTAVWDESLGTFAFNCSDHSAVFLVFSNGFFDPFGDQIGDVDISINNGVSWQNAVRYHDRIREEKTFLDVTAQAAGHSSVRFRWRFHNASFDYFWGVDNVELWAVLKPGLTLTVPVPAILYENDGTATVTVGLTEVHGTNVTVTVTSSHESVLVPDSPVTITAGNLSQDFTLTVLNNTDIRPSFTVIITAAAATFDTRTATVLVLNEDMDADNLGDDWEVNYFDDFSPLPDDDPDADTFTNLAEYNGRTDPTNAASYPNAGRSKGGTKSGCLPAPAGTAFLAGLVFVAGLLALTRAAAAGRRWVPGVTRRAG